MIEQLCENARSFARLLSEQGFQIHNDVVFNQVLASCCGTHLFFEDGKDSDTIDVTIASLDDPTPFAPQKAIFLEDKLPWVAIDESIPAFQTVPKKKPND